MTIREAQDLVQAWEEKNPAESPVRPCGDAAEGLWELLRQANAQGVDLTGALVRLVAVKNSQTGR